MQCKLNDWFLYGMKQCVVKGLYSLFIDDFNQEISAEK